MPTLDSFDLYGKKFNFSYDLLYPIGVTYTQYPGMKSPMELWGDISKWEVVNYHGNFFRAEGGLALPYTKIRVETTNGLVFKAVDGDGINAVSVNSTVGVVGSDETRTVTVTGTTPLVKNQTFTVGKAFAAPPGGYKEMTDVFVLQPMEVQSHYHRIITSGYGLISGRIHSGRKGGSNSTTDNLAYHYDTKYAGGAETRPVNCTMRVWVRVK